MRVAKIVAIANQKGGAVDHRDLVLTRGERDAQNRMMACCSRAAGQRLVLAL